MSNQQHQGLPVAGYKPQSEEKVALAQAHERLRAGAATPLPAADLPAIDEPRVPRRPPLGGDPMRPFDGNRLPPGRYHP